MAPVSSMTGFGQGAGENGRHRFAVSLRSVNARYFDLTIRLKEEYRGVEAELRSRLERELSRGRVDATVEVRPTAPRPARVDIQMEVVRALHAACHRLAERGLVSTELSVGDLLSLPEVVEVVVEPDTLTEEDETLLFEVFERALAQLAGARRVEGRQLELVLGERLSELQRAQGALKERAGEVRGRLQERLERRLTELLGERPLDEARVAHEVALLVDRSDVAEELDRLEAHLDHFREVMGSSGAIGKRLDFLTQEILRELNTLGAKARDVEVTRLVLDAKVACEQLREQVQNVE